MRILLAAVSVWGIMGLGAWGRAVAADLVPMGVVWEFRKGTGEASAPIGSWRSAGFVGTGFGPAAAPFWYGDTRPGGTELADMQGSYSCIYLRQAFVIGEVSEVTALELTAYADDGFVAWINGREVARERVARTDPLHTDVASSYDTTDGNTAVHYALAAPAGYLVAGTNVLSVQAFNVSLNDSSDFHFECSLEATITETTPPVVAGQDPPPGPVASLTLVRVTFSEPVVGVEAQDLLVNGQPARSMAGMGATYTFGVEEPPEGAVTVAWAAGHAITDLAGNAFDAAGPGASWQYALADTAPPEVVALFPAAGAAVAALEQIEIAFSEPVAGVDAADLLINGVPATHVMKVSDGSYVFGFSAPATGLVSVVWAAGHGIIDAAAIANPFGGGAWTYTLDPSLPPADLVINEILAANVDANGLLDEDLELQDWIEIHNQGAQPVDLAGWSLSDDPALPGLWPFPARTLAPGEFLVVFASGKDRKPIDGELHTVFKLGASGEHLGLYTPDSPRRLAAGFTEFPEQRNDISYGFDPAGEPRYFAVPTPGAPNPASTILGVVAPIHVNVARGYFTRPFDLILSCPTPGATFRYTTDGSEPTAASPVFPGSLQISATTLFRAAGFLANHLPSRTVTHSYLFNLPAALRSVPILSIVTDPAHLTGPDGILNPANFENHGLEWERPTSVEWIEPADNAGFQVDCGIRLHGSTYHRSILTPASKFSYRLYFRGDYGPGRLDYPLFPLTTVDRFDGIVLRGGLNDASNPFIRDEIHRRLSHDMGQIASHGNLAVVLRNGVYYGSSPYYNPCERVHEEFFQEHLGGGEEWDVVKPSWDESSEGWGVVDGSFADMQRLVTYIRYSARPANATDYTTIGRWMDLTNYVDYVLLNTYAAMGDWPNNNWRAGRDQAPGGIWRWCVWDAEWGMGIYGRAVNLNIFPYSGGGPDDSGMSGDTEIAYIYQGLKKSPEFRLLWADRVQKHFFHGGALTRENITQRFDELRAELATLIPAMDTEILDWARDRQPIYFGHLQTEGLLAPVTAPEFGQHGGRIPAGFLLAMSAPAGTIYYTTDGSDPRIKFTGEVSPAARAYGPPVELGASVTVRARARSGTTWSALTEATFRFERLGIPLRIAEIMYNPPGGSLYEFLEIANVSSGAVDLGGMYLDGISYAFTEGSTLAGGARLVLGSNTDTNAWLAHYGGVTPFGWFANNLNNGGERIALYDRYGNLITSVDYGDGGGWPKAADGAGASLEVLDADGDPDDPANWQASAGAGGTPGSVNSPPPAQPVYLNELMADNQGAVTNAGTFPDWVEIHNPGSSPVDLGGWGLSDSGDERKYVFPVGTTVPGAGYLVVWCDAVTNITPGLHTGFALAKDGETVSLYDPTATRVDAVSFGLQVADLSVGRVAGDWTLTAPTPGAANAAVALAASAQLAINEWMADPVPGEDDWIELYNRSATLPVALQGIYLGNGGAISRLAALSFLGPHGYEQILADAGIGPAHVDFRLPAEGGEIVLYDATGGEIERVAYGPQLESVSQGRLPDGEGGVVSFPGTASPGAMNYQATYTGPVINEVLARNRGIDLGEGEVADYVEIRNPAGTVVDLGGMSLSVGRAEADRWVFPLGTLVGPGECLLVRCDGSRAASTAPGRFNLGASLDGESGGAYLFNAERRLVDAVVYGPQVPDLPIGLAGGQWALLQTATPGSVNATAATLGSADALVINEWMADPAGGADWFELYNPLDLPVDLATISLTDDPSVAGEGKFRPVPLSYIRAGGFVAWIADDDPGAGRQHVNFALNGQGDCLLVYRSLGAGYFARVDAVAFGAQSEGVSQGRLPDGSVSILAFPGAASPAAPNYRMLNQVVINEVLAHADPPLEDAVELSNPTGETVDLGGWYLSNSGDDFAKYRIPDGVSIAAGGQVVIYEYQFNAGGAGAFSLDAARGGEVWLSKTMGGLETGERTVARFGASFSGVSLGRLATTAGIDYPALQYPTFGIATPVDLVDFRTGKGAANAAPAVGPVIINEVFYHPPDSAGVDCEYIELHNNSGAPVALYDAAHPANRWALGGAVEYQFPPGFSLGAGAFLLVVDFDPVLAPDVLAGFRAEYGVAPGVVFCGPFAGNLDNAGEEVVLYRPDAPLPAPGPDAGFVPRVVADRVAYDDDAPWPTGLVDGGGYALQRRMPDLYGNEPLHWFGGPPTPGAPNTAALIDTDGDGIPDAAEHAMGLDPADPADGAADPDNDGASNWEEYLAGTDHRDPESCLRLAGIVTAADQVVLTFDAAAQKTYSVLYTDALTEATWAKLIDLSAAAQNQPEQVIDDAAGRARFYRLVTPAVP